ncbi:MAG: hypothetical protein HC890_08830 [Chloroflexaceae bacterium]|nr:hypothetical protein [Chloroflexaceae bacterium]
MVRPGFYGLPPNGELLALLNSAGGSTAEADLRNIIVRRPLIDGTVLERSFNLYTPLQNGDSPPSISLQGGDTVIVRRLEVGTEQDYDRFLVSRTTLAQQQIIVRVVVPAGTGTALRNLTLPNGSTFLDVVASLPADDGLFLNRDDVALLRFDPERGQIVNQSLDADKAIKGDIAQDVPLRDGDAIVVSRTLIGKIFNVIRIVTRPIVDIFSFTSIIEDIAEGDIGRGGRRF